MTYDGSSWSTPVSLDSTDDVGYDSSLAIDSNDNLHVTYLDDTNDNLEYMTFSNDLDGDGVADVDDSCPNGNSNWVSTATTDYDGDGCQDSNEDSDDDNDGILDVNDAIPHLSCTLISDMIHRSNVTELATMPTPMMMEITFSMQTTPSHSTPRNPWIQTMTELATMPIPMMTEITFGCRRRLPTRLLGIRGYRQ